MTVSRSNSTTGMGHTITNGYIPRMTFTITGQHAADFRVSLAPRQRIAALGYARFGIEFQPHTGCGTRVAEVIVGTGNDTARFAITGTALAVTVYHARRGRPQSSS